MVEGQKCAKMLKTTRFLAQKKKKTEQQKIQKCFTENSNFFTENFNLFLHR